MRQENEISLGGLREYMLGCGWERCLQYKITRTILSDSACKDFKKKSKAF